MTEREQKHVFENWLGQHQSLLFKIVRAYAFTVTDQDDLFKRSLSRYGIPSRRSGRNLPLPPGYIGYHSIQLLNGQERNENIMKRKNHLTPYSIFCRRIKYRWTNGWYGSMKKYPGLMRLIVLSPYCCWKVSATKKWPASWALLNPIPGSG